MNPIRIIEHSPLHGPGYIINVLQRHRLPYEIFSLNSPNAEFVQDSPITGLILLGGPFDANAEDLPWLESERRFVRQTIHEGIPVLGHGFGAELIAMALDSHVVRGWVKQIGWFKAHPLDNPVSRQWLKDTPEPIELFKWCEQRFSLPYRAQPLLRSYWSPTEAFVLGNVVAIQGHLEVNREILGAWLHEYGREVAHPKPDPRFDAKLELNWDAIIQGPETIFSDLDERLGKLHQAADRIYGRWLDQLRATDQARQS